MLHLTRSRLAFLSVLFVLPTSCASGAGLVGNLVNVLGTLKGDAAGAKSGLGAVLGSLPGLFQGGGVDAAGLQKTLQNVTGLQNLMKGFTNNTGTVNQLAGQYADSLRQEANKAPTEDAKRAATEKVSALEALIKNLGTQSQATQNATGGVLGGIQQMTGMLAGNPTGDAIKNAMGMLGKVQSDGQNALSSFDGMGKVVDQLSGFLNR